MAAPPPAGDAQAQFDAEYLAEMGAVVANQEEEEDACMVRR